MMAKVVGKKDPLLRLDVYERWVLHRAVIDMMIERNGFRVALDVLLENAIAKGDLDKQEEYRRDIDMAQSQMEALKSIDVALNVLHERLMHPLWGGG